MKRSPGKRLTLWPTLVAAVVVIAAGEKLRIAGSSTIKPVVDGALKPFSAGNPALEVVVTGGTSSSGIAAVAAGEIQIAMASRDLKAAELEKWPDLVTRRIGHDGLAILVNGSNRVEELSTAQVQDIYLGKVDNWKEVGGADAPIERICLDLKHGTTDSFCDHLRLEPQEQAGRKIAFRPRGSTAAWSSTVASWTEHQQSAIAATVANPNGIAFTSVGTAIIAQERGVSVRLLKLDRVAATKQNVLNETYPARRDLNLVFKGAPTGAAKAFADFMCGKKGQEILAEQGMVPLSRGDKLCIAGSTTIKPVVESALKTFAAKNPGLEIVVGGGGSSSGIAALAAGEVQIAMASRELKAAELEKWPDLVTRRFGHDGVAIVVHPSNKVEALTTTQLRDIYLGRIDNWKEVAGADAPIERFCLDLKHGTTDVFCEHLRLEPQEQAGRKIAFRPRGSTNGWSTAAASWTEHQQSAIAAATANPNAIAFTSAGTAIVAQERGVKFRLLKLDGVAATEQNVFNESYPARRNLNLVFNGAPTGAAKAFADFMCSKEGQEILTEQGMVPLSRGDESR